MGTLRPRAAGHGSRRPNGSRIPARSRRRAISDRTREVGLSAAIIGIVAGVVTTILSSVMLLVITPKLQERMQPASCENPRGLDLLSITADDIETDIQEHEMEGSQSYDKSNLVDHNSSTAWIEGHEGAGGAEFAHGKAIRFSFGQSVNLRLICVVNGWAASWDLYEKNARLRLVDVSTQQGDAEESPLPDKNEEEFGAYQSLSFPSGSTTFVEMTIHTALPGRGPERANDLAISEIEFWVAD